MAADASREAPPRWERLTRLADDLWVVLSEVRCMRVTDEGRVVVTFKDGRWESGGPVTQDSVAFALGGPRPKDGEAHG